METKKAPMTSKPPPPPPSPPRRTSSDVLKPAVSVCRSCGSLHRSETCRVTPPHRPGPPPPIMLCKSTVFSRFTKPANTHSHRYDRCDECLLPQFLRFVFFLYYFLKLLFIVCMMVPHLHHLLLFFFFFFMKVYILNIFCYLRYFGTQTFISW